MRVARLLTRRDKQGVVVYADVSGQGKSAVRVKLGYLAEQASIEEKIGALRDAPTLRQALTVVRGM